jgi:23S rRNA pseudouridine1911/1915/1917 synthase
VSGKRNELRPALAEVSASAHHMQRFELPVVSIVEERLDHFLVVALPQYSRSRLQSLVQDGCVQIDGSTAKKAGQMVRAGSRVIVEVPARRPTNLFPEDIALDVLYEDVNVLIVNKPAGMAVHPGAGHAEGTLVHAVLAHDPSMHGVGGVERPGVVHRLDKDTSGVIVLAKNDDALHWLQRQFQDRKVVKTYLALVDGSPPSPSGRVEAPIGRDPFHRKRMAIVAEGRGRVAVSEYSTRERFGRHTLLEVHPVTGRTHQVRLHCAFLGCPVAGDKVYGHQKPSINLHRHFLHAWKLQLVLPSDAQVKEFSASLPPELEQTLASLRSGKAKPQE